MGERCGLETGKDKEWVEGPCEEWKGEMGCWGGEGIQTMK